MPQQKSGGAVSGFADHSPAISQGTLLSQRCDLGSDCWRNIAITLIEPILVQIAGFNRSLIPRFRAGAILSWCNLFATVSAEGFLLRLRPLPKRVWWVRRS
jgi:hypothetical protein